MLGSFGVGKTSLVSQYVHSIFSEEYLTTIGVKIDKKAVAIGEQDVNFIIWDLAGQDSFERLQPSYMMGASGFILVVDGTRKETLQVAKDIMSSFEKQLGGLPFVCAINKSDLRADWQISDSEIEELQSDGWKVVLTSATSAPSVESLFETLGEDILAAA